MKNKINKFEDVLRIYFLTFGMTFFITAWKLGFTSTFMKDWIQTWGMVLLGVITLMCFIIAPFVLNPLKLKGKLRRIIGFLILTFVFAFVFNYRFDSDMVSLFNFDYLKTILINWIVLIVIVFPFGMFVAGPIAKKISGPLAKQVK